MFIETSAKAGFNIKVGLLEWIDALLDCATRRPHFTPPCTCPAGALPEDCCGPARHGVAVCSKAGGPGGRQPLSRSKQREGLWIECIKLCMLGRHCLVCDVLGIREGSVTAPLI